MQEHIRRAHPEYYIAKLPATEESIHLMVTTPPSERPPPPPEPSSGPSGSYTTFYPSDGMLMGEDYGQTSNIPFYDNDMSAYLAPTMPVEFRRGSLLPAVNAAAALAQLHNHRPESEFWDSEQDVFSESETNSKRAHFIDPVLQQQSFTDDQYPTSYPTSNPSQPPGLLPSSLARSPPGRSSTLPPIQRSLSKQNRSRKSSVTQNARQGKHERTKSKDQTKRLSHDSRRHSAEPSVAAVWGKRWEDLIDAATSATEEDTSRDLTPIPASPYVSPHLLNRTSLPPFTLAGAQFQSYTASPLHHTLTPPPPDPSDLPPFPSVESSIESTQSGGGHNFHMHSQGLSSNSSPAFCHQQTQVQIYCAGCHRLSVLRESWACTECICGLCRVCVDALVAEQSAGRAVRCPKCGVGERFRPFQLDIR
ncbi:hypothetical protein LTR04_003763 [Oleoguttula sp. CCFEE 6159]|nr:hypothetical protein LTR04_003763 [Oleoguttula sp. CCFEE 6159]